MNEESYAFSVGHCSRFPLTATTESLKTTVLRSSSTDTGTGHRHFPIVHRHFPIVYASQDLRNLPWSLWTFPLREKILSSDFSTWSKNQCPGAQAEL